MRAKNKPTKNNVISNIFKNFSTKKPSNTADKRKVKSASEYGEYMGAKTYFFEPSKPVWMNRNYTKFADEGYCKNVIAFRCISLIAKAVSAIDFRLIENENTPFEKELKKHPVLKLLQKPNPTINGVNFIETLVSYKMISGNSYILAVRNASGEVSELYNLRPDRVKIATGSDGYISHYIYTANNSEMRIVVDKITGESDLLHFKNFNPLDDHFGFSPIEAAAYSIDQHNNAANWNQSLLQNGAKPSGALVVKSTNDGGVGFLSDEQFSRVKEQIEDQFSGSKNAGRPILLEGGLDWKELSLSPKDMDFIESKNSSAREIALAFGVPPQMLGIPGDNTYSNMAEARKDFKENTVMPIACEIANAMNYWLLPKVSVENLSLKFEQDLDVYAEN